MSKKTCHYCLDEKDEMSINGEYLLKNGKFLCYRICIACSKKLMTIHAYSDKQARQTFLTTVLNNAKEAPIYK